LTEKQAKTQEKAAFFAAFFWCALTLRYNGKASILNAF